MLNVPVHVGVGGRGEGGRYDAVYGWGVRGLHASANAIVMGGSFRSAGEVLA